MEKIEVFMRNRCAIEFAGVDLPSECVMGMSPLVFNTHKKSWNDVTLFLNDEIGKDITKKLFKHNNLPVGFRLKKLDVTGEVKETLEITGYIAEYNLGGFSYHEKPDLMGLEYSIANEIEITFEIGKVTLE